MFVDETISWAHAAGGGRRLSACQIRWTKTLLLIWEQWGAVSQICLNTSLILYGLHNISIFQTGNAGTVMLWLEMYEFKHALKKMKCKGFMVLNPSEGKFRVILNTQTHFTRDYQASHMNMSFYNGLKTVPVLLNSSCVSIIVKWKR